MNKIFIPGYVPSLQKRNASFWEKLRKENITKYWWRKQNNWLMFISTQTGHVQPLLKREPFFLWWNKWFKNIDLVNKKYLVLDTRHRGKSVIQVFVKSWEKKILQNIDSNHLMIQNGHMPPWPKCVPIFMIELTQQARIDIDHVPLWREHDQIRLAIYIFFRYFVFIFLMLRKCVFLNTKCLSLHDYDSLF